MAEQQVVVAWSSVRRALVRLAGGGELWLALKKRQHGSLVEFADAVDGARERLLQRAPETSLLVATVTESPSSYLVQLTDIDDDDLVEAWVNDLAAGLSQRGLSGRVSVAPSLKDPSWLQERDYTHAAFVHYNVDMPYYIDRTREGDGGLWCVDAEADARIAQAAAAWAYLPDALPVLSIDGYRIGAQFDDLGTLLRRPADDFEFRGAEYWRESDHRAHRAKLWSSGKAVYQVFDEDTDWRPRIESLRDAITAAAADTTLAYIRPANFPTMHLWVDYRQKFPGIRESDVRYNRHLIDRYIPDAHGIQILTGAHLAHIGDLPDWDITDLDNDRYLVQAPDLEPWYSTPLPDPDTVEKARTDFAGALLTKDIITNNPPPWQRQ